MARWHAQVPLQFVIMLGDNLYGRQEPTDFVNKFARPYAALLDAGIPFFASLGNHDDQRNCTTYPPFNMRSERYYTFNRSGRCIQIRAGMARSWSYESRSSHCSSSTA